MIGAHIPDPLRRRPTKVHSEPEALIRASEEKEGRALKPLPSLPWPHFQGYRGLDHSPFERKLKGIKNRWYGSLLSAAQEAENPSNPLRHRFHLSQLRSIGVVSET